MKTYAKQILIGGLLLGGVFASLAFMPRNKDNNTEELVQVKIIREVNGVVTMKDTVLKDDGNLNVNAILTACGASEVMPDGITGKLLTGVMELVSEAGDLKVEIDKTKDEEEGDVKIEQDVNIQIMMGENGEMKMVKTVNGKDVELTEEQQKEMEQGLEFAKKIQSDIKEMTGNLSEEDKEALKKQLMVIAKDVEEDIDVDGNKEMKIEIKAGHAGDGEMSEAEMKAFMEKLSGGDIDIKEDKHMVIKKVIMDEGDEGVTETYTEKITVIIIRDPKELPSNLTDVKKTIKDVTVDFYPNPSTGQFQLSFEIDNNDKTDIAVYDLNGKKVYEEAVSDFQGRYSKNIDISNSGAGTYFLQIRQGRNGVTKKVVVQ